MTSKPTSIVIHGGIREFEGGGGEMQDYRESLRRIVENAHEVLHAKGARTAVLTAVKDLEDDPLFNAGTGSRLQADGKIRMSAALMDGTGALFSGVINLQDVRYPIEVAALLAAERNKVLGGEPATNFARDAGFPAYSPYTQHRLDEHARRQSGQTGTVGAVAMDADGGIFAATSTGGTGGETPGRVSDSATVAGNYATAKVGVSCTGVGEEIVNLGVAMRVATRIEDGMAPAEAVRRTVAEGRRREYLFGLIALDLDGAIMVEQTAGTTLFASHDGSRIATF